MNIKNIRKLPFLERIQAISFFKKDTSQDSEKILDELTILMMDYPYYNFDSIFDILNVIPTTNGFFIFLKFVLNTDKDINIAKLLDLILIHVQTLNLPKYLWVYLINLSYLLNDNIEKYPFLTEYLLKIETVLLDLLKQYGDQINIFELKRYLAKIPCLNKYYILESLITIYSNIEGSNYIINLIRTIINNMPENDEVRIKISNLLSIYDIIT